MTLEKEYIPYIKEDNGKIEFTIQFKNTHGDKINVRVTKAVFLQFFGIHQHVKKGYEDHYFIVFKDKNFLIKQEVSLYEYIQFQSFKSIEIHEQNIYDRYIEHCELSEAKLYHRKGDNDADSVIDHLYKEGIINELHEALASLPEVQRRRLILHYQNGLSLAQIAEKECCSKSSVQCSIKIARSTLNEKFKKFRD